MPLSKVVSNSLSLTTLAASGAVTLSSTLDVTGVTTVQAGTAALPAITTTGDTNTGIFFPAADQVATTVGATEGMRLTSTGLGIGTSSPASKLHVQGGAVQIGDASSNGGATLRLLGASTKKNFLIGNQLNVDGALEFTPSTTDGGSTFTTPAMVITGAGNLVVGATSATGRLRVLSTASQSQGFYVTHPTTNQDVISCENSATSGNNILINFYTDATVSRGTISFNRAGGLTAYNTTSDYRAKDISGPVTDSGALIDATPVYMGKMKGATQERPMFIAHEAPAYAHTGEKDAVDADGKPVYQQMDASALVPVMWAELQSLRTRVAQLESN